MFRREREDLLKELRREGDVHGADQVLNGVQRKNQRNWEAHYRRLYVVAGQETMRDGLPPGMETRATGIGVAWGPIDDQWWSETFRDRLPADEWVDDWLGRTIRYAEKEGSKKIKQVNAATRFKVKRIIRKGSKDGMSVSNLMESIDRLYLDQIIPNRSEVIARTELLTAARAGDHNATLATGFGDEIVRDWLTSGQGDRTRDTHAEAEASQLGIPLKEPFIVGGAKLMFPGDTSLGAPAEEVVQCMCTTIKRLPR